MEVEARDEGPVPQGQRPLATPQPRSGCCLSGEGQGQPMERDLAGLALWPRTNHTLAGTPLGPRAAGSKHTTQPTKRLAKIWPVL